MGRLPPTFLQPYCLRRAWGQGVGGQVGFLDFICIMHLVLHGL